MLNLGNVCIFQWYFTGAHAFGGILQKLRSFGATEPIFPYFKHVAIQCHRLACLSPMLNRHQKATKAARSRETACDTQCFALF